ncbi:MAG: leucine-rich repeat domain-containing protein, partial [Opitutaceae bacterium]
GGVLFGKSRTKLIQYPARNTQTSYDIPADVTCIGKDAFTNCSNLTNITIPNSVTSIEESAFVCCGITSVTIPKSVTSIGDSAFWDCYRLTSLTIQNGVTSIEGLAFRQCTGLTSVTIPQSVTSIGDGVFDICSHLTEIKVDIANPTYVSLDGVLFNKSHTELIQYPAGNPQKSYVIPNGVTSIREMAFDSCTALTSVTIPNSVTSIGGGAFEGCTGLTSVTIPASVTSIGDHAFEGCTNLTSTYFQGNAPELEVWYKQFAGTANNFTVYYLANASGFTNPWHGYKTAVYLPGSATR